MKDRSKEDEVADININKINKYYGDVHVIKDISLDIKSQSFTVLVGPSGCGKSTMLRMIAGLEDINSGTISIDGKVVNDLPPKQRNIAMVFQSYALYPHMTVFDNMAFGLKLEKRSKDEINERVLEAARILQIEEYLKRKPKQLSGGQRQRVAIARALLKNAPILLLDEATSSLDNITEKEVQTSISHLMKSRTSLIVAHRLTTIEDADIIYFIKNGKIAEQGNHMELLNKNSLYSHMYYKESNSE